jgi:hypothetical protein
MLILRLVSTKLNKLGLKPKVPRIQKLSSLRTTKPIFQAIVLF